MSDDVTTIVWTQYREMRGHSANIQSGGCYVGVLGITDLRLCGRSNLDRCSVEGWMDSDTHPKVVDSEVGDLVLDPVERAVVAGAVLLLHEVRQVGHARQLVQVRAANIFMVNKYFSNIFRLPGEVVRL